jgi:TM2 domain-containing membrane protein YozV
VRWSTTGADQVSRSALSIIALTLLIGVPTAILIDRSNRAGVGTGAPDKGEISMAQNQMAAAVSAPAEKFCFQCGEKIHGLAEICPKCGLRQPLLPGMAMPVAVATGTFPTNSPNKLAAALFALLLGGIGIHKFYLGRIGWGIVYLLFCWTFIPAIVAIIEGIVYLSMSDAAFAEKYAV